MNTAIRGIQAEQNATNERLTKIEEQTRDIPLIKQAVLETLDITKQVSSNQKSFEKKACAEFNTHDYSIDILNRRQLKFEADLEKLKHK